MQTSMLGRSAEDTSCFAVLQVETKLHERKSELGQSFDLCIKAYEKTQCHRDFGARAICFTQCVLTYARPLAQVRSVRYPF